MADSFGFVLRLDQDGRYIAGINPTAWADEVALALVFESAAEADAAMDTGRLNKAAFRIMKIRREQARGPATLL